MGVNGLWTVVQPCARPTNLATLNRKRLAVDASIWIYQFLKAVRDKEGNALRNSHVVGFFRRICKLLWFGILPVFVFDGGAPALKRATIQARTRRREGRRDDAVKTAGKLLAVQMQRAAVEDAEKRKRERAEEATAREDAAQGEEELPDMNNVVYAGELGMSQTERQQSRKFHKKDQYHLPELDRSIANMGRPEDPRIMSVEELEEYARQFNNGEDVNLYDFSKIDFDGDFFKSLPPPDRYNILNAARLRSRLRLGLSKEQLDEMFPDRMAFSRFQIERVQERNNLTQRLMRESGMTGLDLTLGQNGRIAGDKDREYILVKNEGAEGGWALGVVSKEKDVGEEHKPIDVDAIQIQFASKDAEEEEEDVDDFEDVPIEGINRLPRASAVQRDVHTDEPAGEAEDSLFVGGNTGETQKLLDDKPIEPLHPEEEDDISKAIAMSLENQHGHTYADGLEPEEQEEEPEEQAPVWNQRSAEIARPTGGSGGSVIARIVNNRASAAVTTSKQREEAPQKPVAADNDDESDSDEDDVQAVLAKSRLKRKQQPTPAVANKKNPFDGPLPFPKLDWRSSVFARSKPATDRKDSSTEEVRYRPRSEAREDPTVDEDDMAGGFEKDEASAPAPLPPWLADESDIRENLKKQQGLDRDMNAEDRAEADEEERLRNRRMREAPIEIGSSSDDGGDDVQILEQPPSLKPKEVPVKQGTPREEDADGDVSATHISETQDLMKEEVQRSKALPVRQASDSPEPEFENVEAPPAKADGGSVQGSPEPTFEDVAPASSLVLESNAPVNLPADDPAPPPEPTPAAPTAADDDDDLFADVEYDEFSDPEDEELLAQLADEADEHARFASELNNKSAQQNKEDYEKELRQLRNQQKKDRRDADEVTQVMVTECQALLRLFGIPYITAPMEAEAQCASLVNLGLVDGIVTDDSDIFLFGGTRVYKNMFNTNKFVECYLAGDLEKELSLSREQLISLAQLLGSDYTEGLPGVGPVTAVEILSEFPGKSGLDHFREWWLSVQSQERPKEADASSTFRKKFRKSQGTKLFLPSGFPSSAVYDAYLYPEVDDNTEPFQWGVPDLEGLRQFLMATIGWSKERTDEVLVPVIKDMNKRGVEGTQANITRFFSGGVGTGAREAFAPRQKTQGSRRMLAAVDRLRSNLAGGADSTSGSETGKRKRTADADAAVDEDDNAGEIEKPTLKRKSNVKGRSRGNNRRSKAS
ncbi:DNA repair protein-like protein [Emericellopsis cladophorae]|uniref:DNA repair protein-like protein n=1 Tax=Emericellopsis cladophorae TaxID=2686198 RepID=A0A9Q0BFM6_9HYPO|nr:DNA repair protein-like protein [Emericellopsis cladophorae]KAI6783066.1 DNA repair protein-like protein [Emericellopsis cladophorae]